MSVQKVIRYPRKNDQVTESTDPKTGIITTTVMVWYKVVFTPASTITWIETDATAANDGTTAIPQSGASYFGSDCIVRNLMAMRSPESPWVAEVQVTYSNQSTAGSGKSNANITIKPIDVAVDAYVDANNKLLRNPLREWYDPLPKQIHNDYEIRISFTTSTVDVTNIATCKNCMNSSSLTLAVNGIGLVCPANSLLFKAPDLSTVLAGSPPYQWQVVYVLQYRGDSNGWLYVIQNRSYYCFDPTSGNPVRILNTNGGGYAATPQLIDKNGHLLASDVEPTVYHATLDPSGNGGLMGLDMVLPCDMSALLSGLIE